MRKKGLAAILPAILSVVLCAVILLCCGVSASALDDKYTIDELGLSLKIPKEYYVVTRTLERDDEVFSQLKLDYDETMTAFSAADIYLQAISDDGLLKVTLTEASDENSKAINNYSELSEIERKQALDAFMNSGGYTSGVEIKHNGNIYFDLAFSTPVSNYTIYCYQCHTVINGMNINLTLQKNEEELTADEIKAVTDMANTVSFDKITLKSGPSFEWWRFLLWIVILVAIAFIVKYFYSQYNKNAQKTQSTRRPAKRVVSENMTEKEELLHSNNEYQQESGNLHTLLSELGLDKDDDEQLSFDELLGYDTTDYRERANTELDSFDIKVKSKDKRKGVSYFEDSGKDINSKRDYFDEFFSGETEHRPFYKRAVSTVTLYAKMLSRRVGNFFKKLFGVKSKKQNKKRR
ncbi:MAG: hypothetical protein IJE16_07035 [Ruminococcus sp.]|nr:hypothetical protein [Ruminococcus sp.]